MRIIIVLTFLGCCHKTEWVKKKKCVHVCVHTWHLEECKCLVKVYFRYHLLIFSVVKIMCLFIFYPFFDWIVCPFLLICRSFFLIQDMSVILLFFCFVFLSDLLSCWLRENHRLSVYYSVKLGQKYGWCKIKLDKRSNPWYKL